MLNETEQPNQQVDFWEKNNADGLQAVQKAELFISAIFAIEQRTLKTLSSITLEVVVDRALHEGKEKFPFLSSVKVEPSGLNFSELIRSELFLRPNEELLEALRFLLIEILTVLGNITAGILVKPLYEELLGVKFVASAKTESEAVTRIHSDRKNSENS